MHVDCRQLGRWLAIIFSCLGSVLAGKSYGGLTVTEEEAVEGTTTVFHMTVSPAAEPSPALKYCLWLYPEELTPGNSATHYLRAYPEGGIERTFDQCRNEFGDSFYDWASYSTPIEKLPLDKVRISMGRFDSYIVHMIQPGTRCRESDWGLGIEEISGPEYYQYLLPDFQAARNISRVLAIRTRLAIAEGRFEDAIECLRMNYRLGRDVGQVRFLVCGLVGIAIEGIANGNVIDLIAAPQSPNIYWALAEVPAPLVDCKSAVHLEMNILPRIFPPLADVETAEHSPAGWSRILNEAVRVFTDLEGFGTPMLKDKSQLPLLTTAVSLAAYPAAKNRLHNAGSNPEELEKMAVGHVLLIDAVREFRQVAEAMEKLWYAPHADAVLRMEQVSASLQRKEANFGKMLAGMLLPAVQAVRHAQDRQLWQKNALLVLEALRMHAAATGRLPHELSEIFVVPVPQNPLTGKPYVYRLENGVAVLELPFSDGMPGMSWRFEMQLADEAGHN